MQIYVVDAFTNQRFRGNSAAVIPVDEWLDESLMLNIAAENNLSETAFIKKLDKQRYHIRWFSPLTEIDFCGHATLASAFILYSEFQLQGAITFVTDQVGELVVAMDEVGMITMRFPLQAPTPLATIPAPLLSGLDKKPHQVLLNRQAYFAILESEQAVREVSYDREQLKRLAPYDVVVTAQAENKEYDFVSRYFWPANGGDEDPVTGSIHSGLAPYWAKQLNKKQLTAYQASQRGGILNCQVNEDHLLISGTAVLYLKGNIFLD